MLNSVVEMKIVKKKKKLSILIVKKLSILTLKKRDSVNTIEEE